MARVDGIGVNGRAPSLGLLLLEPQRAVFEGLSLRPSARLLKRAPHLSHCKRTKRISDFGSVDRNLGDSVRFVIFDIGVGSGGLPLNSSHIHLIDW